jgi:DNA-binding MarR family transcriptional regulator
MKQMNSDQKKFIKELIENSKKINSRALTLTRCLLLALMNFNKDGLQFRELIPLLNISDGKLKSNLDFLEEVGYINKVQIQLDQKKLHIYLITEEGENELKNMSNWMKILINLGC